MPLCELFYAQKLPFAFQVPILGVSCVVLFCGQSVPELARFFPVSCRERFVRAALRFCRRPGIEAAVLGPVGLVSVGVRDVGQAKKRHLLLTIGHKPKNRAIELHSCG